MFYRGPDTIWLDRMVLFIMKLFSDGGGLTLLLVRSFYYFEVLVGVKLRFDDQPYTGGCQRSDKSLTLILTQKKGLQHNHCNPLI
jgi:hypothetical protein